MADDEIVVEIEKDGGETETVKTDQAPDPVEALKAQLEDLTAQGERDRAAADTARRQTETERQARVAAESEVQSSRSEIVETRLGTVESGLEAAKTESTSAKAEYVAAQEAGDWKRAADAQERLAAAQAKIVRLDEARADLEIAKTAPRQEQQREQPRVEAKADPLETFITSRSPKTQEWLRAHPDEARALALGTDSRRAAKINAADNDAIAEGFGRDTPEYFAHVDKFLGISKEAKSNGSANGKSPARKSAPVAPVNGSAGPATGGGDTVRLTAGEAKSATDGTLVWNYNDPSGQNRFKKGDPIGVTELARRKLAMEKEGRYNPMNFVQQ